MRQMKAKTEKPLSPEFQANRSMFRHRPESRKKNAQSISPKWQYPSIVTEKFNISMDIVTKCAKYHRKKMICKKLKTNLGQKFLGENFNRHRQIQNAQSISRKLTISSPEKMIGGKFQSKMRKVSAGKNDLQKIENKFLENLVKSGPAKSWRPGNKIMAPGEIQNAQSISRKKNDLQKIENKF